MLTSNHKSQCNVLEEIKVKLLKPRVTLPTEVLAKEGKT